MLPPSIVIHLLLDRNHNLQRNIFPIQVSTVELWKQQQQHWRHSFPAVPSKCEYDEYEGVCGKRLPAKTRQMSCAAARSRGAIRWILRSVWQSGELGRVGLWRTKCFFFFKWNVSDTFLFSRSLTLSLFLFVSPQLNVIFLGIALYKMFHHTAILKPDSGCLDNIK